MNSRKACGAGFLESLWWEYLRLPFGLLSRQSSLALERQLETTLPDIDLGRTQHAEAGKVYGREFPAASLQDDDGGGRGF